HTRFSRDWSSDVCSSDLLDDDIAEVVREHVGAVVVGEGEADLELPRKIAIQIERIVDGLGGGGDLLALHPDVMVRARTREQRERSEERRVGKESGLRWAG